ncbi:hypothetical protein ICN84_07780 [Akkermansia glycaniphila]|uniref:hypothetical protein n=1 Tax=Akkermansia glycaniphila TaxID=1679444 RepID=UPI001C0211E1|nr:hypothetical protein [Akkermansia glycaniphila]MBT9449972.1 hypothetical protein [Akkermansia glycaniphila]
MTLQQSHRIADSVESLREAKASAEETKMELNSQYNAMPYSEQVTPYGNNLLVESGQLEDAIGYIDRAIEILSPYYN